MHVGVASEHTQRQMLLPDNLLAAVIRKFARCARALFPRPSCGRQTVRLGQNARFKRHNGNARLLS